MMSVYNNVNLSVDYANNSTSTRGSIHNLTLLGIQLVRDTGTTGTENILLNCASTVQNNNLVINVTRLQNTNLNRMDGLHIYLDSIDIDHLVGDITTTGTKTIDLTKFVGGWTTGSKTVYFVPYRDASVLTKRRKFEYDTVNQILTQVITRA